MKLSIYLSLAAALAMSGPVMAQERWGTGALQNDVFVGRDGGGYTNGIAAGVVDGKYEGSALIRPASLATRFFDAQPTFSSAVISHVMATPQDITTRTPDPRDVPYVAGLFYRSAQAFDAPGHAELVALTVGVTGPAAGGRQVQKWVHKLTGSDEPMGWDTQRGNRFQAGLEYARAWRLAGADGFDKTPWRLVLQGTGTVSTFVTMGSAKLQWLYGSALHERLSSSMSIGATTDPMILRQGWLLFSAIEGTRVLSAQNLGTGASAFDPPRLRRNRVAVSAGLGYSWGHGALSFALNSDDPVFKASSRRQSYGSLTYTFALR